MKFAATAGLLVCLLVTNARADDRKEIDRVIDKAVQAAGGADKLGEIQAVVWKTRAILHGPDGVTEMTGEYAQEKPNRYRAEITTEKDGKKSKRIIVVNDQDCWINENGQTRMMDARTLADTRESNFGIRVANDPSSLRDPDLKLSLLGPSKLGGRKVIGIRVSRKGHSSIDLYFDDASGLTAKTVMRQRDGGREVPIETVFTYHHDAGGVVVPHKATTLRDGKAIAELELLEIKTYKTNVDDSFFARP